ncbi:hypothetical protein SOVF_051090 [Spinacia oleracea]|nr:hypothetical protein SOVF_051090 [Spinacia oleracea]
MEDFFYFFHLNEEDKFKAAIIGLDGEALRWFEGDKFFHGWQELKDHVLLRFGLSPPPSAQNFKDQMEEVTRRSMQNLQKEISTILDEAFAPIELGFKQLRETLKEEVKEAAAAAPEVVEAKETDREDLKKNKS